MTYLTKIFMSSAERGSLGKGSDIESEITTSISASNVLNYSPNGAHFLHPQFDFADNAGKGINVSLA